MKKVMLLASMLAMVMVAAAPALAQDDNVVDSGNVSDSGNTTTNTDAQYQSQNCAVIVQQYNAATSGDAANTGDAAIASTAAAVDAPVDVVQNCIQAGGDVAAGQGGGDVDISGGTDGTDGATGDDGAVAGDSGEAASGGEAASASYDVLPDTGGASLIALGAGALLVAGGLLARKIVR